MKFATIILPLLVVSAQSAPLESSETSHSYRISFEDYQSSSISVEDSLRIQSRFDELEHAFADMHINPTEFFCLKELTSRR